jgi:bifunctional non-homologous end joining protein LigD
MDKLRSQLARYRAKRSFDKTPEPDDKSRSRAGGSGFIVQKHAASHLHYDFRLEMDGVLKSWACVKGPSLDPADRRLAVHVEDHPVAYGTFEGTIPKGQYGGGTVMLWDRGTWEPLDDPRKGLRDGRLKFTLEGERMKGGWMLVRMGGHAQERGKDNWLLIKEKDKYAKPGHGTSLVEKSLTSVSTDRTMDEIASAKKANVWQSNRAGKAESEPASKKAAARKTATRKVSPSFDPASIEGARKGKMPDFVPPTLATLVEKPPSGSNWIHEIKIDGYRIFARRQGGKVKLLTRTGIDWTGRFGTLADDVAKLPGGDLALDGEIAVIDAKGHSGFGALQDALSHGHQDAMRYILFDLLYADGHDLRGARLLDRKTALKNLIGDKKNSLLTYSEHFEAPGSDVFHHACSLSLEGIISKRGDQSYVEGRTRDWVKSKCVARQEFVIAGFTDSTVHRGLGALALGYYDDETLRYAGRVGTGFNVQTAQDLAKRLKPLVIDHVLIEKLPAAAKRGVHWVSPELVCEIEFLNWTSDGVLRHPSFQGLREDKPAKNVTRDKAVKPSAKKAANEPQAKAPKKPVAKGKTGNEVAGVTISHPDRVVFPDIGVTKYQLAEYYRSVADWMLPHVANRPLSLLRCPSGVSACFFQKHFETGMKGIDRLPIKEKSGTRDYLVIRDTKDLVTLAQEGIIEIHPWGAKADDPDKPDQIIFDFDPAPDLKFDTVVDAARTMREYLDEMGLQSVVKTTGGKGLHVITPLRRGIAWKDLKDFTRKVAANFVTAAPGQFTDTSIKAKRTGKIFLDYLRNDRGSTAVAPYCVRARAGAPVSMPVDWKEIKHGLDPMKYNINTVPKLLAARKSDPWDGMTAPKQTLGSAQRALGVAA